MIDHKKIINIANSYASMKNANQNVKDKLINWNLTRNYFNHETHLIEPISARNMNSKEKFFFKTKEEILIEVSSKLSKNYIIYHSKMSKNYAQTCSYIIKYKNNDSKNYVIALINYFFKYLNKIYVCVKDLNITTNDLFFNNNGNNYSKEVKNFRESGLFKRYFDIGFLSENEKFINAENIICKCICIYVIGNENYFYFSEFDNENEHD